MDAIKKDVLALGVKTDKSTRGLDPKYQKKVRSKAQLIANRLLRINLKLEHLSNLLSDTDLNINFVLDQLSQDTGDGMTHSVYINFTKTNSQEEIQQNNMSQVAVIDGSLMHFSFILSKERIEKYANTYKKNWIEFRVTRREGLIYLNTMIG